MNERQQELRDIQSVMKFRDGRRFMWRVLEKAGVYDSSFAVEPSIMAFKEGQRNIGLMLISDIMKVAPDKYQMMTKEAQERAKLKEMEDDNRGE